MIKQSVHYLVSKENHPKNAIIMIFISLLIMGFYVIGCNQRESLLRTEQSALPQTRDDHVDNFQYAFAHQRAVVSSLYDDGYALPLRVLGYSLQQVKCQARMVAIYIPSQVSERSLCKVRQAGWELYPVDRIPPPHYGTAGQFKDQYTKLHIFNMTKFQEVIYLDADTLAMRNFDELWHLPTELAAVPDIYLDDRGFTLGFNAGVMFVRPSQNVFRELLTAMKTTDYPREQAEQAFLNAHYKFTVHRLPYMYNGNLAIKAADKAVWAKLWPQMRIIHYTLHKPHKTEEHSQRRALFESEWKLWWDTRRAMEAHERTLSDRTKSQCQ